jgi:hypothetical protein
LKDRTVVDRRQSIDTTFKTHLNHPLAYLGSANMAPENENKDLPLPPVPDVVSKMPWIQLGDFEVASSRTPPPKPYPARSSPTERAAARFNVHGNAVCMKKPIGFI